MDKIGWCWEKSGSAVVGHVIRSTGPVCGKVPDQCPKRDTPKQSKTTYYVVVLLFVLHCLLISLPHKLEQL